VEVRYALRTCNILKLILNQWDILERVELVGCGCQQGSPRLQPQPSKNATMSTYPTCHHITTLVNLKV
jgi:hypothetical protein